MIESQQYHAINISVQDEDISTFMDLLSKLLIACKQTGFKKPFNTNERDLIERIAESLNLDKPQECVIDVDKNKL